MKAIALGAGALALAAHAAWVAACGHCIEDRVAAVYDHAVVKEALERRHKVAFFALQGPVTSGEVTKRTVVTTAESLRGVDKGSVRVSVEPAAVALAFDPSRISLPAILGPLEAALARRGLTLAPVQVMDRWLSGQR
ncbi:MAG TPA: hypothetical protein VHA15_07995 [Burkholderiales bacterium]|nr:hypothetical protein [Burkholderiales bacterium]